MSATLTVKFDTPAAAQRPTEQEIESKIATGRVSKTAMSIRLAKKQGIGVGTPAAKPKLEGRSLSFDLDDKAIEVSDPALDRSDETAVAIRTVRRESGHFIDPHTAVAIAVAEKETRDPTVPMVVLGTAHAAKFPDAMEAACGVRPPLPDWLSDLQERPERVTLLPADPMQIERHILSTSRATREGAAA